jgi:regulation of enolase protein 1 (concanavalin A-like superfamily)
LYNYYGFTIEEAGAYSGHSSDEFKKYLQVDKKAKAQQLVDKFEFKLKNEM